MDGHSAMRTLMFTAIWLLAGCASPAEADESPPAVELSVSRVDATTAKAIVNVTNRSRKTVLIRTNELVWQQDAVSRQVNRPNYNLPAGMIALTHDARLKKGESRRYMEVNVAATERLSFPAIHVCWDNREWTCNRYWLIPAQRSWDELLKESSNNGDRSSLENTR